MPEPPKIKRISPAFTITFWYVVAGAAWIYCSDRLLTYWADLSETNGARSADILSYLQTIKGWLFIGVTASLLFLLIRHYFNQVSASHHSLRAGLESTITGLVRVLDLRHEETRHHTERVTRITVRIARKLDIGGDALERIRFGAILHDIGKIGIPDYVLKKPGPLNDDEWTIIRRHPEIGRDLINDIDFLQGVEDIPWCHHENFDGSGYPRGLRGTEIPIAARIFAVVDVWDALSFERVYKKGWPQEEVRNLIRAESGRKFDPHIVDTFLEEMDDIAATELSAWNSSLPGLTSPSAGDAS